MNFTTPGPSGSEIGFAFGTTEFTRHYDPAFQPRRGPASGCLQFHLDSREAVDATYRRLTGMGFVGHLAPIDAFWGSRYAEVTDPDGNIAGFQSPRDEQFVSAPPEI